MESKGITLPYKYKGLFDRDYEIIGWRGNFLQTRTGGRVFTLRPHDKDGLLKFLGLKDSDIPGAPRNKFKVEWEEDAFS